MADRKYLDETGLSTFWTKVKSLFPVLTGVSSVAGNANSGSYLSVRWYVSGASGITAPYDGMRIMVKIPRAGVGTAGVVLSLNGNTAADYHPVAYNINTVLTTHYAVDSYKIFVYDANASMACYLTSNTKSTITGVWKGEANYDSNTTTTYGTLDYYFRPYAGQALSRYKLVALDKDNRVVPISNELYQGDYASTTTYAKDQVVTVSGVYYKSLQNSNKNHAPASSASYWQTVTPFTATTAAFKPEKIWFFSSTGNIAVGGVVGGQTLVEVGYSTAMFTYNFTGTGTAYRMVYLKGTYNRTTGLFTLDNSTTTSYFTLVPCNTASITLGNYFVSGADYILVGAIYTTANYMTLFAGNPMFRFDGANLIPYDTYNAKRVEDSIPTTASQVGALPDDTNYVASASVSGNTLTLTPSSGTAITFTPSATGGVTSVNNQTGAVTLTAADVGALPDSTAYVASASVSNNTLTLTPSSGNAVTFSPTAEKTFLTGKWTNKTGYSVGNYHLVCEVDGGLCAFNTATSSNSNTKTTVSPHYIPNGAIAFRLYVSYTSSNSVFETNSLYQQATESLQYSFNIGGALLKSGGGPVYIKCSVNSDGTVSPSYDMRITSSAGYHPIVTELPSTEDGYVYVYLGRSTSATNLALSMTHPIYEYKNGAIRLWQRDSAGGSVEIIDLT